MRRFTGLTTTLLQRQVRGGSAARYTAAAQVTDSKASSLAATASPTAKFSSANKSQRPWLARLGIIGAAACMAAANLEEAPITHRKQIMFGMYKPKADSNLKPLTPIPEPNPYLASLMSQLEDHQYTSGLQLMQETSNVINTAISSLAQSDPALQRQLSFTPGSLELKFGHSLQPGLHSWSINDKGGLGPGLLGCYTVKTVGMIMGAGQVLQSQSPADFINAMSTELAHRISNHEAEARSCSALANAIVTYAVAATAAARNVPLVVFMGLCFAAMLLMDEFVTKPWVQRQQTYEADVIAAAISTSAGCQPDSILSFMHREHYAASLAAQQSNQCDWNQSLNWEMAALHMLLPNSKLPTSQVRDSRDLQLVQDAAAAEVSSASSATQAEYKQRINQIRQLLAHKMIAVRGPMQGVINSKPCWLDRIAHIEKVLSSKATYPAAAGGDVSSPPETCQPGGDLHLQRIATLLQGAQDQWPFAMIQQYGSTNITTEPLKVLKEVRSKSAKQLAEIARTDAARHFDWQTYFEAWRLELSS